MPIPEMTPAQKYEKFCQTHPQYKKMSMDQICSIMIKEKILNESEIEELKKPLFNFKEEATHSWQPKGYENLGLYIGTSEEKNTQKPTNYVEKPKKYHPQFPKLEITDDGKVNLSAYTLENLQKKYDKNNYDIKTEQKNNITITTVSDKNGQPVFSTTSNKFFGTKYIDFYNGQNRESIILNEKNEITEYETLTNTNGKTTFKRYNIKTNLPESIHETYPNGDRKNTSFDKQTGQIIYQDYWTPTGNSAKWFVEYSNGKPYKIGGSDTKTEYPLVDDLEADITAKNKLGLPTTRPSIEENVLKRITYSNVYEILNEYKNKTGRDLTQDINDEIGLSKDTRDKLINHIETLYCKSLAPEESGDYLAQKLFDDIQGLGSGKLSEHVKMIDSRNLKYVLVKYRELTNEKLENTMNNTDRFTTFLTEYLGFYVDTDKIAEDLTPIEGLLTAISDEWGLKESERKALIKQIIDASLNDKAPEIQSRIRRDIESHPEDNYKIEVDIYRAENANRGDLRNPELKNEKLKTKENKTFSGQIKQGETGDCWLLAGLNSIITKPEMRKELEKLVKIDPKTGDYLVELKGEKKTYRITKTDLNEYTALSTGSEKVNAIEIAMDKFIRDENYNDEEGKIFSIDEDFGTVDDITIDGNFSKYLWRTLFGYNPNLFDIKIDSSTEDFNNPERVYSMSLKAGEFISISNLAKSEKQENYEIISRHAYSIIGSDDENIYLLNPWDSEDKITITRENFKKLDARIELYEIPKN